MDLARVQNFVGRTSNLGVAADAFKSAIETIRTNVRWTQKNVKSIYTWLQETTTISKKSISINSINPFIK